MWSEKDITAIKARGSKLVDVQFQIENFKKGFPNISLTKPATIGNGITQLSESELNKQIANFEQSITNGTKITKFVPASGAASRMFKSLFEARESLDNEISDDEALKNSDLSQFYDNIELFAFFSELEKTSEKLISDISLKDLLDNLLTPKGLNYGNLPKGLLKFHMYGDYARTPFEEHCVEGALYAKNANGKIYLHFTVSPEHQELFEKHANNIIKLYEQKFSVSYEISFSCQKASTDTLAVDLNNEPFRNKDNSLLFRPAGHGALLENLNDLDTDIVFIKNIDNVIQDRFKSTTVSYKKALAGLLIDIRKKVYRYQEIFDTYDYSSIDKTILAEAAGFLRDNLNTTPPNCQCDQEALYNYLKQKFNRPIRVCGMVRNQGEPGGGPFVTVNTDKTCSLQIVESSQIDFNDPQQKAIANQATHFNPVDLICSFKNYKGEKYHLSDFSDPQTGFISNKSKDGMELKAQELPGLWNGAMSDWITVFVEVPIETFSPVKTVLDLLRKEHQPE